MAGSEVIEIIWERAHTPGLGALTLHLVDQGFSHSKIDRLINEIKETFFWKERGGSVISMHCEGNFQDFKHYGSPFKVR